MSDTWFAGRAASSLHGCGAHHIVRRKRPPDPLQLELADWLDLHGILDLHQHARANENLTGLGLVAKPRGDVRHRANGGVVEPALEADGAERGEAVRYPMPKPISWPPGPYQNRALVVLIFPGPLRTAAPIRHF